MDRLDKLEKVEQRRLFEELLSTFMEKESISYEEKLKVIGAVELVNGYLEDRKNYFDVDRLGIENLSEDEFERIAETEFILTGIVSFMMLKNF